MNPAEKFLSPPGDAVVVFSPASQLQRRVATGEDYATVLTDVAQKMVAIEDEASEKNAAERQAALQTEASDSSDAAADGQLKPLGPDDTE